ncbi:hypothetical protein CY35_12G023300 [Sphagnum magellanicum]|nr:hypothetical protein CY35_12G023300 [Sphagnum magellanicum]
MGALSVHLWRAQSTRHRHHCTPQMLKQQMETPYGKAGNNCTTMMLFREYMHGGVSSCHDVQKRVAFFMQEFDGSKL